MAKLPMGVAVAIAGAQGASTDPDDACAFGSAPTATAPSAERPWSPRSPSWFEDAFGFPEPRSYEKARSMFRLEESKEGGIGSGDVLVTVPRVTTGVDDGGPEPRRFHVGAFSASSVAELRAALVEGSLPSPRPTSNLPRHGGNSRDSGRLTFRHATGTAEALHFDPTNAGSVFQAASQFNCLEMVNPRVRPDDGITDYWLDRTQGPSCALACPAGTVYRNYFVGRRGQGGPGGSQLDLLSDVGNVLGNVPVGEGGGRRPRYWKMKNGYALPSSRGSISDLHARMAGVDSEKALGALRVGVHWDTEVAPATVPPNAPRHRVAQVYCSALPLGYDYTASNADWEPFAQLVLDGAYEATLAVAAVLSQRRGGSRVQVFLTMLGGGVFRNDASWISNAIERALDRYKDYPLDVVLVHFRDFDASFVDALSERSGE